MAWLRWGRRSDPELTEMGALLCWCLCWRYRYTYRMQIQMKIQMRQPSNYNSFGLRGHRVYKKILYLHPRDIELSHCSHLPSRKRLFRGWVRLWTVDKLQNNNVAFIVRQRKAGWDGGCLVLSCSDKIFTQLLHSRVGDIFTYWFSILNLRTKLIYHHVAARETVKTPWCFVPLNGCQYFSVQPQCISIITAK